MFYTVPKGYFPNFTPKFQMINRITGNYMKVLIVVDMQNDFVDGALGTSEAMHIVEPVKAKIATYKANGDAIFYTQDTHTEQYLETQEGKRLPVTHCIKGTPGWDLVPGVYLDGCPLVEKPAFGSLELAEKISRLESVEFIELVGLCTDICVISNALIVKARMPEIPIRVDASCCAGVTPESHRNALQAMKMCQIEILNE